MNVRSAQPRAQAMISEVPSAAGASAFHQLLMLLRALGASAYRWRLALLAVAIVVVICGNMVGQVRLNVWQGDFFDALEQRHLDAFVAQFFVFLLIVAVLLSLVVAETWLRQMVDLRMREWLTQDLLERWLVPKRAYLLGFAGEVGVNPDQRIHADTQHLTELSAELSIGLLRSTLLLLSFIGVLWVLSAQVVFTVGEHNFSIPGYMVWCALAYAVGGSWLAWRVGRPLIALNAERYAREADLRFALVRVNESAEGIALYGGEADERRLLDRALESVIGMMVWLAGGLARLTWVTSGFGWLALVAPILVAAPGYFGGELSFGGLMMVVGAFNQVQQALRWFVDNFPRIADWRATLLRVVNLREALPALDTLGEEVGRIELVEHDADRLELDGVSIALADGLAGLDQPHIELGAGERLLILGQSGSGKSMLFRALAGLWPWGSGTIRLPRRDTTMFMPQRPYLPLGTLRDAVVYPAGPDRFADAAVSAALVRVALSHLVPLLDREERWDKDLSLEEQQRLAFARMLMHAPRWVFLDDALGALDEEHRKLMLSIFERELDHTAVVSIERGGVHDGFYHRTANLVRLSEQRRLRSRPRMPSQRASLGAAKPTRTARAAARLAALGRTSRALSRAGGGDE